MSRVLDRADLSAREGAGLRTTISREPSSTSELSLCRPSGLRLVVNNVAYDQGGAAGRDQNSFRGARRSTGRSSTCGNAGNDVQRGGRQLSPGTRCSTRRPARRRTLRWKEVGQQLSAGISCSIRSVPWHTRLEGEGIRPRRAGLSRPGLTY